MRVRTLMFATLLAALAPLGAAAQNASATVAGASKAMGVDNLNSITYSGAAALGSTSAVLWWNARNP